MEHARTRGRGGLGKVTRAADLIGKQARVVRAFGGDRVRACERAEREKAEAPAKAEAAASKLLKRHWKAGDVGTTSAGFSEARAAAPKSSILRKSRSTAALWVRRPEPPPVSEAELAALLRGAARARGAEGGGAGGEEAATVLRSRRGICETEVPTRHYHASGSAARDRNSLRRRRRRHGAVLEVCLPVSVDMTCTSTAKGAAGRLERELVAPLARLGHAPEVVRPVGGRADEGREVGLVGAQVGDGARAHARWWSWLPHVMGQRAELAVAVVLHLDHAQREEGEALAEQRPARGDLVLAVAR